MTNEEAIKVLHILEECGGAELRSSTRSEAVEMAEDALKSTKANLLSFNETHGATDPIILEIKGYEYMFWVDVVLQTDIMNGGLSSLIRNLYDDQAQIYRRDPDDYGKKWRCWDRKPTDEQRIATAWKE